MKKVIILFTALLILLASSVSAYAMGFEAEEIYNSIFVITTDSSIGSGFALGKNIVVTNTHVIENSRKILVTTYSGHSYNAAVISADSKLDIAFLAVEGTDFVPLTIGNPDNVKIGDDIYTVGAPNSMAYTLTKGVISAKERKISGQTYIQIDAAINSGNSGGPLLDDFGNVLGMNTLKMSNSEGIGLSIPITRITAYAESAGVTFNSEYSSKTGQSESPTSNTVSSEPDSTENSSNPAAASPKIPIEDESGNYDSMPIIITVSAVSIIAIIAIIVVYKKNSGKYIKKLDPSERTDFEIDIEE